MAATTGVVDTSLFRGVFEGCISGNHTEVERRPYHRNCSCALHKSSRNGRDQHRCTHNIVVSYPIRRSKSEGCLALAASSSAASVVSSPSSSPAMGPLAALDVKRKSSLDIWDEEDLLG
ncbi:hypothetical protein Ancab_006764 [Ancistrocladus abbreviatus]